METSSDVFSSPLGISKRLSTKSLRRRKDCTARRNSEARTLFLLLSTWRDVGRCSVECPSLFSPDEEVEVEADDSTSELMRTGRAKETLRRLIVCLLLA